VAVIADIQDGSEVADSINATGGSAVFRRTDATQAEQVAGTVRHALDLEGRVDVLLCPGPIDIPMLCGIGSGDFEEKTGAALPLDGGKAAGTMPADRYRLDFPIRR
jgi:hypothetical protein